MIKHIFGLGSGRCGTTTLSALLNKQKNINVTHEIIRLPWIIDINRFNKCMNTIINKNISGDVSFYYLNYVDMIVNKFDNIKFICLKRDRQKTINSFIKKTKGRDHWNPNPTSDYYWYECFPKYNKPKLKSIQLYIDDYYKKCYSLQNKYPKIFKIFKTEILNSKHGQFELFNFLNILKKDMIFDTTIRKNKSGK